MMWELWREVGIAEVRGEVEAVLHIRHDLLGLIVVKIKCDGVGKLGLIISVQFIWHITYLGTQ